MMINKSLALISKNKCVNQIKKRVLVTYVKNSQVINLILKDLFRYWAFGRT